MRTKKCLKYDISGRIYMSDVSRQPYPKGRTAQPGSHPSPAVSALARGGPETGPELFHLRTPSLSLPGASTATQAPRPGRRCQSVLHRKALAQSRKPTPRLRRLDRIDLKRDRQPCLPGGPAPRGRSWLSRRPVSHELCIWNTTSTDYCRTSWSRPTNYSRRTGARRLLQARRPRAARRL